MLPAPHAEGLHGPTGLTLWKGIHITQGIKDEDSTCRAGLASADFTFNFADEERAIGAAEACGAYAQNVDATDCMSTADELALQDHHAARR